MNFEKNHAKFAWTTSSTNFNQRIFPLVQPYKEILATSGNFKGGGNGIKGGVRLPTPDFRYLSETHAQNDAERA